MPTITICIPTYNRTVHLMEAVRSCLNQHRLPDEILIGDDSTNDQTETEIKSLIADSNVPIRYTRNKPSFGQAKNVNALFSRVSSELLILLHDDDLLTPKAIGDLESCFADPKIDAAYGKQYLINEDGVVNFKDSEGLNTEFYRSAEYSASKLTSLEAGFLQQFPNDGYLIKTNLAREIGYSTQLGDACDFDFGLRVGMSGCTLLFLDIYTAKYRNSSIAVSKARGNDAALRSYELVAALPVPKMSEKYKERWLGSKSPVAISEAINTGQINKAIRIYFGKYHRKKMISPGGVKRLFLILSSLTMNKLK